MLKKYMFILLTITSLSNTQNTNSNSEPQTTITFQEKIQDLYNNNQELFKAKNIGIAACVTGMIGMVAGSIVKKVSFFLFAVGGVFGSYHLLQNNDELKKFLPSSDTITNSFYNLTNLDKWRSKTEEIKRLFN
jgi:hypothetical protein